MEYIYEDKLLNYIYGVENVVATLYEQPKRNLQQTTFENIETKEEIAQNEHAYTLLSYYNYVWKSSFSVFCQDVFQSHLLQT